MKKVVSLLNVHKTIVTAALAAFTFGAIVGSTDAAVNALCKLTGMKMPVHAAKRHR